jgi:hypothetical protein
MLKCALLEIIEGWQENTACQHPCAGQHRDEIFERKCDGIATTPKTVSIAVACPSELCSHYAAHQTHKVVTGVRFLTPLLYHNEARELAGNDFSRFFRRME